MNSPVEYQLLIPASQDFVFRFYQDCYHWNVWFQGIAQSWFEREPMSGVKGRVIFNNGSSWKLTVVTLYDDSIVVIQAKRFGIKLVFEVEIERVRDRLTKVSHRISFFGITGFFCQLLWKNNLQEWLQMNLYTLSSYAELDQKEQEKLIAQKAHSRKKRKLVKKRDGDK